MAAGRYGVPVSAMGEEAASPTPDRQRPVGSRDRRWDGFRWVLLTCWLLVVVTTVVTGERDSSWQQVRDAVAAGEVRSVRVVGELPADARGFSSVGVHWRQGLIGYTTGVVQVRGQHRPGAGAAVDGDPVLREPPSSRLSALQPGLEVTRTQQRSGGSQMLGWHVPSSLGFLGLLLFCAGLVLLAVGPEPWRATRWGWFWLQVTPVGSIVFLVLSGPTAGLPGPRDTRRRLTGGWAFLLSVLLGSALAPSLQ